MEKNIPFYANKGGDTHCFQAALKMVLGYYLPERNFPFSRLDELTGHKEGRWTYPYKAYIWLAENGFTVTHIEDFSVEDFVEKGEKFLKEVWDPEVYKLQKQYSDFETARRYAKEAWEKKNIYFKRERGTLERVIEYANKGCILLVRVNPCILRGENGDGSHIVVIKAIEKNKIVIHDPGLPPLEDLVVTPILFKKAMYQNNSLVIAVCQTKV
ncbi:MAG: hypothetical protein WDZ90_02850 [Candidatus Paceibacterota bacterium]